MKKKLLLLAVMGMCINLYAGNLKPIAQKIYDQKTAIAALPATTLFTISNSSSQENIQLNAVVSNSTVMEFSHNKTAAILSSRPANLNFVIPTKSGGNLELELYQSDFFTSDFTVVTSLSNGQPVSYSGGVHYWGIIKGDNTSLAAISIFNDEVMGMISSPSIGNLVLGKLENDPQGRHILYNDRDLHAGRVPRCDTPEDGLGYGKSLEQPGNQSLSVNCIRLYWEVNFDIFTGKGSVTAATNYVTSLFNQSAILYTNDNIPVSLSQVFVWDVASPYTGTTTSDLLNQFHANVNSFNGDLGHLLGYVGGGGIAASTNGLCNSNIDSRQCYSDINSSFSNVPTYSWSVEVVTHEQGHLMGSRHTHDCAWNGNNTKIDSCGDAAGYVSGNCSVGGGNQALPSGGGTIMSYCHLVNGIGINFSNGFGTQPKAAILTKYNAASCLTACAGATCNAPTGLTTGSISQSSAIFSWTTASGATSYNVRYRIVGAAVWTTGSTSSLVFTAAPLTSGSNYEWQVQTVCSGGSSGFTNSTTFTTGNITSCGSPTGLSTTGITGNSATLNWAAISCDSLLVRYFITSIPSVVYFTSVTHGTATSKKITGLLSSTNYSWLVRTYCNGAQSGHYSSTVSFTTTSSNCGTPANLASSSITGNSAVLSWTSVNGATGYNIRYRIMGTSIWTNRTSAAASTTASSLSGSSTYEWQVQSICSSGSSAFTNSSSFTTLSSCNAPSSLSVTNITSTSANLQWNAVTCDSFLVRYFVTSAPNIVFYKRVSAGTATSTGIAGLTSGTAYSWKIRTYCNNAQSGVYSFTNTFTTLSPSPEGIEEGTHSMIISGTQQLIIYPNPAKDHITMEFSARKNQHVVLAVYDLVGHIVLINHKEALEGLNVIKMETASLNEGIYFIGVEVDGILERQRVIISR
ncbi:hypothetical protein BH11BAC1_BH11BAC1_24560 [soil metagenome]